MFRIKICGITRVEDACAAMDAGADAIGLNFYAKSKRYVEPDIARQIAAELPASVMRVGVFVNHQPGQIDEIVEQAMLDCVQLHGDEPPALLGELTSQTRVIRAVRCGREGLRPLAAYVTACRSAGRSPDAVLLDADAAGEFGGTGRVAEWSLAAKARSVLAGLPLILAGGLTPENVAEAIAVVRPDGVDVASGVESAPGRKEPALVARFVAAARQAYRASNGP